MTHKKFDEAVKEFQASTGSDDIDLQQQSLYNLGNAEFRLGQGSSNPQERMAVWEQAVQHYDSALKLNPNDKDAEFNRDFVRKKLEKLKQQQQEQKKNNDQDNKDEDREDKDDASKDQQKQDNKDQQNKDGQSREQEQQDNPSQEQQQKKEQQQDQQEKKDEPQDKQSQAQQGGQKESDNQKPEEDAGQYAQLGKMTPAQAKQLLDSQRDEEKALIFIPQERKSDARSRSIKDW